MKINKNLILIICLVFLFFINLNTQHSHFINDFINSIRQFTNLSISPDLSPWVHPKKNYTLKSRFIHSYSKLIEYDFPNSQSENSKNLFSPRWRNYTYKAIHVNAHNNIYLKLLNWSQTQTKTLNEHNKPRKGIIVIVTKAMPKLFPMLNYILPKDFSPESEKVIYDHIY